MNHKISIKLDSLIIYAELNDSVTAEKIFDNLPLESVGNLWGEQIHIRTDIRSKLDPNASVVVQPGDIVYWPPEMAICIIYGNDPDSTDGIIRAPSAVNKIGKVLTEISLLDHVQDDCQVMVTRMDI